MYFQRVLAQKSGHKAMILSIVAGFLSLIAVVAPIMIGAIAASTGQNMMHIQPCLRAGYPLKTRFGNIKIEI